ncbi:MAG: ABC transporter ATP-binding protein [Leptonema sp. (in: bacteria)]
MILKIKQLHTYYKSKKNLLSKPTWNYALKDFNLEINQGDFIGIVGESGCGKTTLGNTIAGLIPPYKGEILFKNQTILSSKINLLNKDLTLRRKIQMIFQDPYSSLNPKHKIKKILSSGLLLHKLVTPNYLNEKLEYILSLVHLNKNILERYPFELSGGQRQRIGIARAISLDPEILICDEITSALDVSVQAYIINVLFELKEKLNLTILFITHDLSLVKYISNTVCVMYGGEVLEIGSTKTIFSNPKHPYTKSLLNAIPTLNRKKKPILLEGEPPKVDTIHNDCIFYNRCPIKKEICKEKKPELYLISSNKEEKHYSKCFFN